MLVLRRAAGVTGFIYMQIKPKNTIVRRMTDSTKDRLLLKQPPEKPYYLFQAVPNKAYAICRCGQSRSQPFCDGSHQGSGKAPITLQETEPKNIFICACGKTANNPHCDGSHKGLAP